MALKRKGDNMTLSKNLIREYQRLYKLKSGKEISPKEAEQAIFDLKDFIRLITKERKQRHGK